MIRQYTNRALEPTRDPEILAVLSDSFAVQYVVDPSGPDVLITSGGNYLDALTVVSKDIGLAASLPPNPDTSGFVLSLSLSQHWREWKRSQAFLGFDTNRSMLRFGRQGTQEIWIGFAPRAYLAQTADPCHAGFNSGHSSVLTRRHFRIFALFVARVLSRMRFEDVMAMPRYPDDPEDDAAFNVCTNIL